MKRSEMRGYLPGAASPGLRFAPSGLQLLFVVSASMQKREVLPTFRKFLHPVEDRRRRFGNDGQYERQICAFVDILGVRRADKADPQVREGLLDLFWSISAISAPYTANLIEAAPPDSYWWGPEISAFSDCFVVSYPLDRIEKLRRPTEVSAIENVLYQLRYIVGAFAAVCLSYGFLLRGAITVGDLYHSDSVILGPALDEAYEAERKEAIVPRILVSEAVRSLLPVGYSSSTLRLGEDGRVYLDYICDMIFESAPTEYMLPEFYEVGNAGKGAPASYYDCVREWLGGAIEVVNTQIQRQADPRVKEKWVWFASELRDALARRMTRGIFEDYRMSDFTDRIKIPSGYSPPRQG